MCVINNLRLEMQSSFEEIKALLEERKRKMKQFEKESQYQDFYDDEEEEEEKMPEN